MHIMSSSLRMWTMLNSIGLLVVFVLVIAALVIAAESKKTLNNGSASLMSFLNANMKDMK